jgi:tetratricopeptide (TPR) repeat protein
MKTAEEYYRDIIPLMENKWYQAAISAFEQLLQTHPAFARGHYELGTLHYSFGTKAKVQECYQKAIENDPDNIGYLKSLADFYHAELEQIEPALKVYKTIIDKGTDDAETLFIAANLCVALNDFENAALYYQKVLEVQPWHSEAFEYLEKIKKHQTVQAQAVSPEELYQKSQEAGSLDNIETAVSILEKLVGQYPDHAVAHNDLAVYYQKLGKVEQSLYHFKLAVQYEPRNFTFKKNLADFYFVIQGDVVEALKIYLNVLEFDPEDIEVLMAAGQISAAVNDSERARAFFNRVLEIEPWNLDASNHLQQLRQNTRGTSAAGF